MSAPEQERSPQPEAPATSLAAGPDDPRWARLAEPFPEDVLEWKPQPAKKADRNEQRNMRGRCQKGARDPDGHAISADDYYCGGYHVRSVHLAYVGHAEFTMRLNQVCSPVGWKYEFVATDANGWPLIVNGGSWIRLTVLGVTKLGFGDMGDNSGANGVKELIGDALRNAGIRFGIATYLWSKSERSMALKYADAAEEEAKNPPPERPQQQERQQRQGQQGQQGQRQQEQRPPQGQQQQSADDDELTLAKRRHREAISKAHPEWDAAAKGQAIANLLGTERTDGRGQPVTLETASVADWAWLAQFWEDEYEEDQLARAEAEQAAEPESAEDAPPPEAEPPAAAAQGGEAA